MQILFLCSFEKDGSQLDIRAKLSGSNFDSVGFMVVFFLTREYEVDVCVQFACIIPVAILPKS